MVSLMMIVSIVPLTTMDEGDAAVGDNELYSYTLHYNASGMADGTNTITTKDNLDNNADMTPISHANQDQFESLNPGSWTWNTTTGIGPFNSFYAAFDLTDGNKFYSILNPNDLTKTIGRTSLDPIGNYNIMWVLPTVYWLTDTNGNVTLTNNPDAGGTAWAHTIDGHVYKYVAYGVYEASAGTIGEGTTQYLKSTSDSTPQASQTREVFRTQAHAYTMDTSLNESDTNPAHSMLWNFYQWTLYKMCSLAVMNDWNSQAVVGGGHTYGSTYAHTTGTETDTRGSYAGYPLTGSTGDSTTGGHAAKLFIENAWGGVNEFVDGVVVNGQTGMYLSQSSNPTDNETKTETMKAISLPTSNDYMQTVSTDPQTWGFQIAGNIASAITGVADYIYTSDSSDRVLHVGGPSNTDGSYSVRFGLSSAYANAGLSGSNSNIGSRLAFVFDVGPTSTSNTTVTISSNDPAYGTVTPATVTAPLDSVITVSGNTLTINGTIVTATPTTATAQHTYAFSGWSVTDGATVTEDMVITATFTRTVNDYTVSFATSPEGYGTVSRASVTVPYGTAIAVNNATVTVGTNTVTATPTASTAQYTYTFDNWANATGTVTADRTITATFTRTVMHTLSFVATPDGYGTVSMPSITVPNGTTYAVNGTTVTINTDPATTVTAAPTPRTPEFTYSFGSWSSASGTVTDDTTLTATFTRTTNNYTVSIVPNNASFGSVSTASVTVPYGTAISTQGNVLTIGSNEITATPTASTAQQTFAFSDWSNATGTVTADRTITANFTATGVTYTITWTIDGSSTTSTYAYGTTPAHAVPTKAHYTFAGWVPEIVPVTKDAEYTATWTAIEYTVTWDPVGGSVNPTTSKGTVESAVPVPTPVLSYNEFDGWFTDRTGGTEIVTPYYPQSNITYYAHWTPIEYTVTFNANGGESSAASLTGTNSEGIVLPTATMPDMIFYGWYAENDPSSERVGFAGDVYHPTKDTTLYAMYGETAIYTFSINFDLQGGWGDLTAQTHTSESETTYTFTIPDVTPYGYLKTFIKWNTAEDGSGQDVMPGSTFTVDADQSVTLYAVWEDESGHEGFEGLISVIPYIVMIGLILAVAGMFVTGRIGMSELIPAIVGVSVAVLLIVVFMIPLFNGL